MASVQFTLVYSLMLTEIAIFGLLMIPFPDRWRNGVLKAISKSEGIKSVIKFLGFIYLFVGILFADSIYRVMRLESEDTGSENIISKLSNNVTRIYAQRNFYLCGITLVLGLVLLLTKKILLEVFAAKTELKDMKSVTRLSVSEEEAKCLKMVVEMKKVKADIEELKKAIEKRKKQAVEIETLKKQVENAQKALDKIADEKS